MKWVLVAIIIVVVPYTFITLRYRKEGPAFQPYEDMKQRANVSRLLTAGYQRIPLVAERPAEVSPANAAAVTTQAPGGLPADLKTTLVEAPLLAADIVRVTAPATANTLQPYPIRLTCVLPDERQHLSGAELFLRGDSLVVVPTFERAGGELRTRSRESEVRLIIPAGALKPGSYRATVVGERSSRAWAVDVR